MVGVGVAVWGAGGVGAGVWDVQVGLGAGVDWPHPLAVFQPDAQGFGWHCPFELFPWHVQPEPPPPPELAAETLA